ncbi:MAG TPA: phage tail tape measure protein [Pseudolabrys sp.]|nr:phage tail tape measure protein [Pseudolabrys sp.]
MTDSENFVETLVQNDLPETFERVRDSTATLGISTASFARAISRAFADATAGGKQFDDVLKQLALRLSNMALMQAFSPAAKASAGGLGKLFDALFGGGDDASATMRSITPFATGGVIGTPAYFPLSSGGLGLAGEAGPEAVLPLARGSDGRLGVASNAAGRALNVTIQITTPDVQSFRRSEAHITGEIARAVARGQRGF